MCAECHGVYDGVPFDKGLNCKSSSKKTGIKSLDEVLIEVYSNFNNSGCNVNFFLPRVAKAMNLRTVVCFPKLVSTIWSKLPPEDNSKELCENGPLMLYSSNTGYRYVFRNFYCSLEDIPGTRCSEMGFYIESFIRDNVADSVMTMSILIDEKFPSVNRSTVAKKVHLEACTLINNTKVGKFAFCITLVLYLV